MKTKTINIYSFTELSDEAKERAVQNAASEGWTVDYKWWESTYDDAKEIGLKITSFDLDRNRHCEGELLCSMNETIDLILAKHGDNCDTHKLALSYRSQWDELVAKYSDAENTSIVAEDNEWEFDQEADELESEFLKDLQEEYASILQTEYEYLQSDECISEFLIANEYEFDEDGNLV